MLVQGIKSTLVPDQSCVTNCILHVICRCALSGSGLALGCSYMWSSQARSPVEERRRWTWMVQLPVEGRGIYSTGRVGTGDSGTLLAHLGVEGQLLHLSFTSCSIF